MNIRLLLPPPFFISSLPWIYWRTNPLHWTPTFHCSPTLTLTFQLPAALNTPPGVSLFTFHYLYFVYISSLTSAQISAHAPSLVARCQHLRQEWELPLFKFFCVSISARIFMHVRVSIYCRSSVTAVQIRPPEEGGGFSFCVCVYVCLRIAS